MAKAVYRHNEAPYVSLFSSFNVGSGNGAHSALVVNASQRVIFDPAGTFAHPKIPERHDVLFGISPQVMRAFIDYHARETYFVTLQRVPVSAQTAEFLLNDIQTLGPVPDALCTRTISQSLARAPGFPGKIRSTWFPDKLSEQFKQLPGADFKRFDQYDDADKEKFWETATL